MWRFVAPDLASKFGTFYGLNQISYKEAPIHGGEDSHFKHAIAQIVGK